MKEITIQAIENEQIKCLFNTFFDYIQSALDIKDKNKKALRFIKPNKLLRKIVKDRETLQFNDFNSFIKKIKNLEKNQDYMDTTEWKVLTFLSPILLKNQNPVEVYKFLDYLNQDKQLEEGNFSIITVASIIYCLRQLEPLNAYKILQRLYLLNLLTEQNLGRLNTNQQIDIQSFSSILNKLNLLEENETTNHLLTQANLDKLLDQSELNLEILAKFIQAEDKSTCLTQEHFDIVVENMDKLEKTALDPANLIKVLSLLGQAKILTQDNFDRLITLNKDSFEKIVLSLDGICENKALNQAGFSNLLDRSLNARVKDEKVDTVDSKIDDQPNAKASFLDSLLTGLKGLLYKAFHYVQALFNQIIAGIKKIVNSCTASFRNTFFSPKGSGNSNDTTDTGSLSRKLIVRVN